MKQFPNVNFEEWLCEVCRSFSAVLQAPLHGFDLAFHTPPFRASPDAQHSPAIGEPNPDGLIGSWLWIIDYLGCHFARAIESKRFHNLGP
jgi:hypothetical protein